jgi:hypothetical protein
MSVRGPNLFAQISLDDAYVREGRMKTWKIYRSILPMVTITLGLVGCGFSGTFQDDQGMVTVTFKSGKATLNLGNSTETLPYEEKGDKILVHTKMGDMVFTKNSDGSLSANGGTLKRKS